MHTRPDLLSLSSPNLLLPSLSKFPFSHHLKPNNHSSLICSSHKPWLQHLAAADPPELGPIPSISSLVSASSDPTLRTTTTILLSAAFSLFLFRSLRRRAKRAKQTRLRSSSGALPSLKKAKRKPPSADEAFLGGLIAAAFGFLLYKFTTNVEYTLNHQVLSKNYSVRQITITIRTIINGLCYLATFMFGFNSIGLFLYSGKLALDSSVDIPTTKAADEPLNSLSDVDKSASDDQTLDDTQKK